MKKNSLYNDREAMMLKSRDSRLMLWDLLRSKYPHQALTDQLIPVDEILPELKEAMAVYHPNGRKCTFKIWQRMRLWPPPEILHESRDH